MQSSVWCIAAVPGWYPIDVLEWSMHGTSHEVDTSDVAQDRDDHQATCHGFGMRSASLFG